MLVVERLWYSRGRGGMKLSGVEGFLGAGVGCALVSWRRVMTRVRRVWRGSGFGGCMVG